jgi:hypothetical protein
MSLPKENCNRNGLLIEIIQQYGAVIEVGVGVGWFGALCYGAEQLALRLVGK